MGFARRASSTWSPRSNALIVFGPGMANTLPAPHAAARLPSHNAETNVPPDGTQGFSWCNSGVFSRLGGGRGGSSPYTRRDLRWRTLQEGECSSLVFLG